MKNTRKLERFKINTPAQIIPVDFTGRKRAVELETINVSAGGAFFHTGQSLPEGTQVDVNLVLPLGKLEILKDSSKQVHLKISGRVVRSEKNGIAVCFDKDYQISQLDHGDYAQESEKF